MKSLSGKEFAKILEQHGWTLYRTKGSHFIYGKKGSIVRLTVPIHGSKPLKKGLLAHLMRMAELTDTDLEK